MEESGSQVLIVEDSEEMLWAIANVLEKAGFTVDAVTTGKEAIGILNNKYHQIKVVVINYILPDMSGVSVINLIRSNGCKAEVIGISALKDKREVFLKAGAFAFLDKPFDIRELVHLCKQALNRTNAAEGIHS
ncbi:MAG: response regulator [Desulfobacteraceae bacterium]|nr:response regulator [Desulfobacteraceae bacterium]